MNKTTSALLARICEEKGIELDKKLRNDVDTVLALISDELVEEGVIGKLNALERRVTEVSEKYRDSVTELAKRITTANAKMNDMEDIVDRQRRAVESLIGKDGRRYMLPAGQERAQAARDLYAGMLDDSLRSIVGKHQDDPAIIAACIEAASLVAWRFIDGPRSNVQPEDKANGFPGLRLKQPAVRM